MVRLLRPLVICHSDPPSRRHLPLICWEYCKQAACSHLLSSGTASAPGNCSTEVTPVGDVARIQWPTSARWQSCPFAHLKTTLKVIPTRLDCWIWMTTQFFLLSIPAAFPLFYKYWFLQAFCLINILQVMLHLRVCILENPGWDAPLPILSAHLSLSSLSI